MRVVNLRKEKFTHYIGRGSIFGNPYKIGVSGTRQDVVGNYEKYARNNPTLLEKIKTLPKEAVLGCYCAPLECHGNIIIKIWKELHNEM